MRTAFVIMLSTIVSLAAVGEAATYGGGSGTAEDPWQIWTAEQMNTVGLHPEDWGGQNHFKLMADIDMSVYTGTEYNIIGNSSALFSGEFDGNGHLICNLTYTTASGQHYVGLFGYTNGRIKNVGIENVSISSGGDFVGGLAGYADYARITACYTTGSVSGDHEIGGLAGVLGFGCVITRCYTTCSVHATNPYTGSVGGLAAINRSSIVDCFCAGPVTLASSTTYAGGLVGWNDGGTLAGCFWDTQSSGWIAGVGVGTSEGAAGKTTADMQTLSTFTSVGWDFAYDDGDDADWRMPEGDYARLAWEFPYGGGSGTAEEPYEIWTAEQMNNIGLNPDDWDKSFRLMADIDMGGYTGTAYNVIGNSSKAFSGEFDGNGHVIRNLTYETGAPYNPVGMFRMIRGAVRDLGLEDVSIVSVGDRAGGLAGYAAYAHITNCYVTGLVSGRNSVGGLMGYNGSSDGVSDCWTDVLVSGEENVGGLAGFNYYASLSACDAFGPVSGKRDVGGLIGNNNAETFLIDCYAAGTVTGTSSSVGGLVGFNAGSAAGCWAAGSAEGSQIVGGLMGYNAGGILTDCCATGAVYGGNEVGGLVGSNVRGTITRCYAAGSVGAGWGWCGGLVGLDLGGDGVFAACFWDTEVSGRTDGVGGADPDPDGVAGKTTAEMQVPGTFASAGWDFTDADGDGADWAMPPLDYPWPAWAYTPPAGFRISGQVTDKTTHQPIENMYVWYSNWDTNDWSSTYTDASGEYVFTDVPPGEIHVRVDPHGTSDHAMMADEFDLNSDRIVDFSLPMGATLSGTVIDVANAEDVGLEAWCLYYDNPRCYVWDSEYVDGHGRFTLTNLPPGIAQIEVAPGRGTGYAPHSPWNASLISLEEGQYRKNVIVGIEKGNLVTGRFTDTEGAPLVDTEFDCQGLPYDSDGRTDSEGRFAVRVPAGAYAISLEFDASGYTCLPVAFTVTDADMDLGTITAYNRQTGQTISGTITSIGNPAAAEISFDGYEVVAFEAGTLISPETIATLHDVSFSEQEKAGDFLLEALPPGSYDVYLVLNYEDPDEIGSTVICDSATNIPSGTAEIELTANLEGGTVTGQIVNGLGQAVMGDETVMLTNMADGSFAAVAGVGELGHYSIHNVPAGQYELTVSHHKYVTASKAVEIIAGQVTDLGRTSLDFSGEPEGPDLNGNGCVDFGDLAVISDHWLSSNTSTVIFNQDSVDFTDFARLADYWDGRMIWNLGPIVIDPSLVGHWSMDENTPNTIVADASGNGLHGTAARNTQDVSTNGIDGQAFLFNGTGDFVRVSDDPLLSPSGSVTICGWFLFEEPGENTGLVWKDNYNFALYMVSERVRFSTWNVTSQESRASFSTNLLAPDWNHMAAVFDGTSSRLYLNGQATGAIGSPLSGGIRDRVGDLYIGMRPDGVGDVYFHGAMDDIRIYSRALTAEEIMAIYDGLMP